MPGIGFGFQFRRDTAALWTSGNPVLRAGELGLETDTAKFKFGDGTTAWITLVYSGGSGGSWGAITGTLSAQTDLQNALNLKATLASPTFTGVPAAPTAVPGTNTTQLATTAFVAAAGAASGITALTGDVTATGPGSVAATIAANVVTLAKMAQVATASFLGRITALTGNVEVLTAAQAKTVLAISLTADVSGTLQAAQMPALTGDVTNTAGSLATTIAPAAVTLAKQANVATGTVFYRTTALAGAPEVQTLAVLKTDLGLTGTNSGDQTIALTGDVTGTGTGSFAATIAAAAVSLSKMANLTATTILGNNTGVAATPIALTPAQINAMLPVLTSLLNGLAPASGGGTANFLRADGTWQAPAGTAGITALTGDVTATGPGSVAATIATSVALSGAPTAATAAPGTNTTQLATTAFVTALGALKPSIASAETITGSWTFSGTANVFGSSAAASNVSVGTGATTTGLTKTVDIGTAGASGSITNVTIGSAVVGALGTTTINSPTVAFGAAVTAINLPDATTFFIDTGDPTRKLQFDATLISTGTTRTLFAPNASGTFALIDSTQTFTGIITFSNNYGYFVMGTGTGEAFLGSGATVNLATKLVEVGTRGLSGSTTNVQIGSAVAGSLGTTTFNSPTIAFGANVTSLALPTVTTGVTQAAGNNSTKLATTAYVDASYQPLDADLTTIAGLVATTDNFIQSKGSAWASRTVAQVKADLVASIRVITLTTDTVVLTDAQNYLRTTSGTAVAITIPPNSSVAFPVGTLLSGEQGGAGTITLTPGTMVTLNSRGAALNTAGLYAVWQMKKTATDTWTVFGDLV